MCSLVTTIAMLNSAITFKLIYHAVLPTVLTFNFILFLSRLLSVIMYNQWCILIFAQVFWCIAYRVTCLA